MKDLNILTKNLEITPQMPSIELKELSVETKKDLEMFIPGSIT